MTDTEKIGQSEETTTEREQHHASLSYAERIGARQSQYRREELIRVIEQSLEQLTLQELEALYYDMSTKNYINV